MLKWNIVTLSVAPSRAPSLSWLMKCYEALFLACEMFSAITPPAVTFNLGNILQCPTMSRGRNGEIKNEKCNFRKQFLACEMFSAITPPHCHFQPGKLLLHLLGGGGGGGRLNCLYISPFEKYVCFYLITLGFPWNWIKVMWMLFIKASGFRFCLKNTHAKELFISSFEHPRIS